MKALFAVRIGNEDWQEELITEDETRIKAASAWALANGFDRLRIIDVDEKPPQFGKASMSRKKNNPGLMTALLEGAAGAVGGAIVEEVASRAKVGNKGFPGKLGTGQRFAECVEEMEGKKGVYDPKGLCAYIGRQKYGKREFARLANPPYGIAELYQEARVLGAEIGEKHERRGLREPTGAALEKMAKESLSGAVRVAAKRQTDGKVSAFDRRYAMGAFKAAYRRARGLVNPGMLEKVEKFFGLNEEERAKKLSRAFHGRPNRETYEFEEVIDDDRHLAHLGELTELHVRDNKGRLFSISFDDNPVLASTPDANQLVFVGGDQGLDLDDKIVQSGNMFVDGEHARKKRWLPIGEVQRIDYFADKHHLSGPKSQKDGVEYKHTFGEEDGNVPVLMYSPVNERMMLAGGNYEVLDVGIRN